MIDIPSLQEILCYIEEAINQNQFAQGGVVIGILTAIYYSVKAAVMRFINFIESRIIRKYKFSMYIDTSDEAYTAFNYWYYKHRAKSYRNVQASLKTVYKYTNNGQEKKSLMLFFKQFTDLNWFRYKNRLIFVRKNREKLEAARDLSSTYLDKYTITGFLAKNAIIHMMNEAKKEYEEFLTKEKEVEVHYNYTGYSNDHMTKPLGKVKSLDKIFFKQKEEILTDVNNFISIKQKYTDLGLSYKRGYLLYGPPGTGKTSFVQALAKHLHRDLCMVTFDESFSDSQIRKIFSQVPENSIVLIEDIDRFFKVERPRYNLSTILNCLDGVYSPTNVIIIATSNHEDQLDKALLREGRFDLKVKIDKPGKEQIEQFLTSFYNEKVTLQNIKKDITIPKLQDLCLNKTLSEVLEEIQ